MARTKQTARRSTPVVVPDEESSSSDGESQDQFAPQIANFYEQETKRNLAEYEKVMASKKKGKEKDEEKKEEKEKEEEKKKENHKRGMKRAPPTEAHSNKEEAKRPAKKPRLSRKSPEVVSLKADVNYRVDTIANKILSVFMHNGEKPRHFHNYIELATHASLQAFGDCIDNLIDDLAEHSNDGDDDYPSPPMINKTPGSPMYSPLTPEYSEIPGGSEYNPASPNF